jgi:hypothetical protein
MKKIFAAALVVNIISICAMDYWSSPSANNIADQVQSVPDTLLNQWQNTLQKIHGVYKDYGIDFKNASETTQEELISLGEKFVEYNRSVQENRAWLDYYQDKYPHLFEQFPYLSNALRELGRF